MIRLAADENLDNSILRGVLLRMPEADFVRIQDHGLSGRSDRDVLEWAAVERRILVTHDVTTLGPLARRRVASGSTMPGVFQIARNVPVAMAIRDLLLLLECSRDDEWIGQVRFLPL